MRSRYRIVDSEGIYFLTSTIIEWIPALIGDEVCGMLVDSLDFCRKNKGLRLYAYVVMDNHLHLIAEAPELGEVMQSFKRHTARELLALAEKGHKEWLLNQFAHYRKRYKESSQHQVWQEGVHPQLIQGDDMLRQKFAYLHENPVRRGYVDVPEHWRYSSARNYVLEDDSVLEIDRLPW
jgi:REP element-mobilizing transposase RayT